MALPTDRASFAAWCRRELGEPVTKVRVSSDQVDDRIDEALSWYQMYHPDATQTNYLAIQVTDTMKTNKYVVLPSNVISAPRIFDLATSYNVSSMFSIQYQIAQSDMWRMMNMDVVPYYMAMTNIAQLQQILVGKQPVDYNRHNNKFFIYMDWDKVNTGDYIVVEALMTLDPATNPDIWKDIWLQRLAIAMIKKQWGANLKTYQEIPGPGGIKFNAQVIYDEAVKEIEDLKEKVVYDWSPPPGVYVG